MKKFDSIKTKYHIGKFWKFKRSELDVWVKSGESSTVLR